MSTFMHRAMSISSRGKRFRFKWDGQWQSLPDLKSAVARLDRLLDEREWERIAAASRNLGSLAVSQLVEEYLHARHDLAPVTLKEYWSLYRNHIKPALGHVDAATLRRSDLGPALTAMSPKLAREVRSILRGAYRQHPELPDPAAGLRLPAYKAEPVVVPEPEEVEKILQAAADHSFCWYGWCRVTSVVGTRRGETCILHERQIDLDGLGIRIARSYCKVAKAPKSPKTKAGVRELLFERCSQNLDFFALLGELIEASPTGYLFPPGRSDSASPCLNADAASHRFHRMCKRLGLCEVWSRREGREVHGHPHMLRHFVAVEMLNATPMIPDADIAYWLGHSRPTALKDLYGNHTRRWNQLRMGAVMTARVPGLEWGRGSDNS